MGGAPLMPTSPPPNSMVRRALCMAQEAPNFPSMSSPSGPRRSCRSPTSRGSAATRPASSSATSAPRSASTSRRSSSTSTAPLRALPEPHHPRPVVERCVSGRAAARLDGDGLGIAGTLDIPLAPADRPKPAWIVDGQQRALALSRTRANRPPGPDHRVRRRRRRVQRDQFLRINNTKPLPRGLVTELLPGVDARCRRAGGAQGALGAVRRAQATSVRRSTGLIRRSSTPDERSRTAVITDTSVVDMVEESLTSPPGASSRTATWPPARPTSTASCALLVAYWAAVRDVFPEAWGLPPDQEPTDARRRASARWAA